MAKPGSRAARAITNGARGRDLSRLKLSDEEAREVQERIEHSLGMRCNGCGRRIVIGFKFVSIDPRADEPVVALYACTRDDCDFAERCKDGATVMEMIEFAWLDVNGVDAPASVAVARRNAELAAAAEERDPADSG